MPGRPARRLRPGPGGARRAAKEALGDKVFVLGHHYQRDEVIAFADVTGDSFKLAREAARPGRGYIVFCGVHFMAESADILTGPDQQVVLPDLAAGCSMADMARLTQVEMAWQAMADAGVAESVVPVTYMNSSADIKAFCGRNGGVVCTSSNAEVALTWAFEQKPDAKVLFLPTSTWDATPRCCRWASPRRLRGLGPAPPERRVDGRPAARRPDDPLEGHCSVHGRFSPTSSTSCGPRSRASTSWCTLSAGTRSSSRPTWSARPEFIIKTIEAAPPGRRGDRHRAQPRRRLAADHPDKRIVFLDKTVCYCSTMNRIDLPHLVWALESLVAGTVVNRIEVDPETERWALVARADARPAREDRARLTPSSRDFRRSSRDLWSRGRRELSIEPTEVSIEPTEVSIRRSGGELEPGAGTAVGGAGEADPAAVGLDDPAARRQADARSLDVVVDPGERLEHPLALVLGMPGRGRTPRSATRCRPGCRPPRRGPGGRPGELRGVRDQVLEHRPQLHPGHR